MKMFVNIIGLIFLIILFSGCDEAWIDKPENLLPEKQMVNILTDIHISNSMLNTTKYTGGENKFTQADFYYSVLKKHEVIDTVFEQSLLYYSYYPKNYEKMYSKVLDKLVQLEAEYTKKQERPLNLGKTGI